jgi:DNA-binding transcriptional MerR regulator
MPKGMTIGKLATAADVSVDTIRYYERIDLIHPPRRTPSGYRMYEVDTLQQIRLIKFFQEMGFSLDEIRSLLQVFRTEELPVHPLQRMLSEKVVSLGEEIEDLWRRLFCLQLLSQSIAKESETPSLSALLSMGEACDVMSRQMMKALRELPEHLRYGSFLLGVPKLNQAREPDP